MFLGDAPPIRLDQPRSTVSYGHCYLRPALLAAP
jgi:hypothetical protein